MRRCESWKRNRPETEVPTPHSESSPEVQSRRWHGSRWCECYCEELGDICVHRFGGSRGCITDRGRSGSLITVGAISRVRARDPLAQQIGIDPVRRRDGRH